VNFIPRFRGDFYRNNGNINCADCAIVDPPPENEVRPRGWGRVRFLRTRVFYALLRERILMNIRERNLEILRFSLTRFLVRTKGQKNSHFEVIKGRMKGERERERKREKEREREGDKLTRLNGEFNFKIVIRRDVI